MKVLLLIGVVISVQSLYSQSNNIVIPLTVHNDSTPNVFSYILPKKKAIDVILPLEKMQYFTVSRWVDLKSLGVILPVFLGIRSDGTRVIAFDTNLDLDFRDEKLIAFTDTLTTVLKGNYKTQSLTVNNQHTISFDYTIIKPKNLTVDLGDPLENLFCLAIRPHEYRTGVINGSSGSDKFVVVAKDLCSFDNQSTYIILPKGGKDAPVTYDDVVKTHRYGIGDKIKLGNDKYVFNSVATDGSHVVFQPIPNNEDIGNTVGFKAPNFTSVSLDQVPISLENINGQHVLLEFWGTWCGPCKTVLPMLKAVHNRYPNLKMISIAFDRDESLVREFVRKHAVKWDQVFDDNSLSNMGKTISELYGVDNYPSYFIIDPKGIIIYRSFGVDTFKDLENFLHNLKY